MSETSDVEEAFRNLPDEDSNYMEMVSKLSFDIIQAKNGGLETVPHLAEPTRYELRFPGEKTRAMGHALVYIEDFEELGIEAEREYQGTYQEGDTELHRIDIVTKGKDDAQ